MNQNSIVKRLSVIKIFFLVILPINFVFSQENQNPDKVRNENLSDLCKIWGFLKYYHPKVAKGEIEWDEQLLLMIPKVKNLVNKEEASRVYIEWIKGLGEIKIRKEKVDSSGKVYFDKNFDLSWIHNKNTFNQELTELLYKIEQNRYIGDNHYLIKKGDKLEGVNEKKFLNFEFPDENYRLLGLFRYWNTIEYFFPYKYIMSKKWNEVLLETIPKMLTVKSKLEYHLALLEVVVALDDTHANLYTPEIHAHFGKKYIPAYFNLIEGKAVITGFYNDSLAKVNDLKKGDIIDKIDNVDVLELLKDRKKYINGSNDRVKSIRYDFFALNGNTDTISLTIKRGDKQLVKKIDRYEENLFDKKKAVEKYKLFKDENIGYINYGEIDFRDVDKIMDELANTKGLIIDIRSYPKVYPHMIGRRFIKEKKLFAKLIHPDFSYPSRYYWKEKEITPLKGKYYKGKVILLVNEETQSAAEYSAMFFQAGDNVMTIGSQTSGADGDVFKSEFVGYKSFVSGLGVFYPDGTEAQRKGVKIDVEVLPTIKGIGENKDEILERAISLLK